MSEITLTIPLTDSPVSELEITGDRERLTVRTLAGVPHTLGYLDRRTLGYQRVLPGGTTLTAGLRYRTGRYPHMITSAVQLVAYWYGGYPEIAREWTDSHMELWTRYHRTGDHTALPRWTHWRLESLLTDAISQLGGDARVSDVTPWCAVTHSTLDGHGDERVLLYARLDHTDGRTTTWPLTVREIIHNALELGHGAAAPVTS